jgi:hypothetical protein
MEQRRHDGLESTMDVTLGRIATTTVTLEEYRAGQTVIADSILIDPPLRPSAGKHDRSPATDADGIISYVYRRRPKTN